MNNYNSPFTFSNIPNTDIFKLNCYKTNIIIPSSLLGKFSYAEAFDCCVKPDAEASPFKK